MVAIKKKKWFTVLASKEFDEIEVGSLMAYDSKTLIGKNLKVNLASLTGDMKKHNAKITFKIKNVSDSRFSTEMTKYELINSYIRRLVKKGKNKIRDSFVCETKDNVKIRIKPFLVTRNKTKRSVQSALIKKTKEYLMEEVKKQNFSDVVLSFTTLRLQHSLRKVLNKVYPLSTCEFYAAVKM